MLGFSEKYLFVVSASVITVFSALGFYLIDAEPKIKSLVVSGHNHILSFAFGAILFGLIMMNLEIKESTKKWLSIWMSLTFLGPLGLIYAGIFGDTSMLTVTGALFEGSFVLLWLILLYFIIKTPTQR